MKEIIELELSGGKVLRGNVIEKSAEIIVLFDGEQYMYILTDHIQQMQLVDTNDDMFQQPTNQVIAQPSSELSLANILTQAIGKQLEIYVTGNQSLYGTILEIKTDYIVFYTPIYKTIYISTKHLKWLVPYLQPFQLYGLASIDVPESLVVANTLRQQIAMMKDQLIIINNGEKWSYIGKLVQVKERMIELRTAKSTVFVNIDHIKTVHCV